MTWVEIKQFDQTGLISDQPARSLPINAVTSVTNAGFKDGKITKLLGYSSVYGTPTVAPYHTQHAVTADGDPWVIYSGLADVYTYYANTHTRITRATVTTFTASSTTSFVAYGATAENVWTSNILGGVAILNNGVDVPQFTTNATTRLQSLTAWPSTWTCASLRTFREFLIAMDMTESATNYPQKLRWSHPADPGSLPSTWDETDTTKDAGFKAFSETPGILIDSLPMGSVNVVYKSDSAYAMQYIGGQFVFSFNKLFDSGAIGRNAIGEIDGSHIVIGNDDIYMHRGSNPQSLLYKRLRNEIFDSIDSAYRHRSRVVVDRNRYQVWFLLPTMGTGWLTVAWIWNWKDNTWSKMAIPDVSSASAGGEVDSSQAWDSDALTWDSDNTFWNNTRAVTSQVLLGSAANTKLYQMNYGNQFDGANFTSEIQRTGIDFGDANSIKVIRKLRPHFNGMTVGTNVTISVGSQEYPDGAVTWTDKTYTVGTDKEIWPLVRGRYLAWKASMSANDAMELESLEMDVIKNGIY